GCEQPADLAEQAVEVLRLDRDHDESGAGNGVGVLERRFDAVALRELVDSLLSATGDDDLLRLAPTGAEQAGKKRLSDLAAPQDGDSTAVGRHGLSLGGSTGFDALAPDLRTAELERHEPAARARHQVD